MTSRPTTASQALAEPRLPSLLPESEAARGGRFAAPITYLLFGLADILLFGIHAHGNATFSFTPEFAKVSVPNLVLPAAATCYVCGGITLALAALRLAAARQSTLVTEAILLDAAPEALL